MSKKITSFLTMLVALFMSVSAMAQLDELQLKTITPGVVVENFEPDTWYLLHQGRTASQGNGQYAPVLAGDTPMTGGFLYDQGVGKDILKAGVVNVEEGSSATAKAGFLVRFVPTDNEGAYNIQFGTGNWLTGPASNAQSAKFSSTTNIYDAGEFNLYFIDPVEAPGAVGFNVYNMSWRVDNNVSSDTGINTGNTVVTWDSGQHTTAINSETGMIVSNSIWSIVEIQWGEEDQREALMTEFSNLLEEYRQYEDSFTPGTEPGQYDPENGERMSCCYTEDDIVFDGKWLNNYAMSSELSSSGLGGIGTLCHEFGHVMGLPDWYDTDYGTNYTTYRTPNEWDIMDGGSYNGGGHCPPNYSPWEKYFFGWITPENLGSNGQALELTANGTDGYKAYQVNASGKQQGATTSGWCYYFENRQKLGWDKFIPTAGMIIWKVNFNADAWTGNVPNNSSTSGSPLYTLVCVEGTRVGKYAGGKDVFPYGTTDSWEGVEGKPLLDITRDGQVIDLVYIEPEANPVVTWVVDGEVLTTQTYTVFDALELPAEILPLCDEETEFLGWTTEENWADPFSDPADLFTTAEGKKVLKSVTYYALFK